MSTPKTTEAPRGRPRAVVSSVQTPERTPGPRTTEAPRGRPRAVPLDDRLTLRLDDVAQALGIGRRTLERERSAGRFPPPDLHIGKAPLWKPETVRRWVDGGGDR